MTAQQQRVEPPAECFTIPEFCAAHRISRATYYTLRNKGMAPEELRLGRQKVVITKEAAARWRKLRTAEEWPKRG